LFNLLKMGATPGATVLRKNQSFKVYGPKVICWIEPPTDPAINNRCIVVPLQESGRSDLKRISDPEIQMAADQVQRQLLQFRFNRLKSLTLAKVDGDDRLY